MSGRPLPSALALLGALALSAPFCQAQQIYRNPFESHQTSWAKGAADVEYVEDAHAMSDVSPHGGQRSEHIKLTAKQGSHVYYQLPTPRAPVGDELSVNLWVKANRPGVQLMARLVLPHERDPYSLDDRLTTLVRGDQYRLAGRWQRLEVGRIVALATQQQQFMQNQLKRPVNFKDAYIDTLVLNVYGGPGQHEVWIDDLIMGPVHAGDPFRPAAKGAEGKTPGMPTGLPRPSSAASVVEFNGAHLMVNGKRFFFRGIRLTDTPLSALRSAGFNTLWVDSATPGPVLQQAVAEGFRLVPALPGAVNDPRLVSSENLAREVTGFPELGSVLFWDLGDSLTRREAPLLARSAQLVRGADPSRPIGADAWDGLLPYSRHVNLLGVHRWPLMTSLEMGQYREWLDQRRRLAMPGTFVWTWVQTHAPDWYTNLVYDRPGSAGFAEPIGPQPEQIRLLTYTALGSGCRGLGFWSDRFLADSHQGRDRLLGVALLNQELDMLEPLLVTVEDTPDWIQTSVPEVKAAVFRTAKGVLVVPVWSGRGAQYVPGQAAVAKLSITVPQVPRGAQAWEVSPGDVRGVPAERTVGGTKVTLREFGLTSAIVFTADMNLIVRFQEQAVARRQLAAQWTYDLAVQQTEKVLKVERELEQAGHVLPDGGQLLQDAQNRLRLAKEHWDNRFFGEAYLESQRAMRPVRLLMRAQWDRAVKGLDTPTASPYAVSFYTLPEHWRFVDQIRKTTAGANVLPGGNFETVPTQTQQSWSLQDITLDEVEMRAERVKEYEFRGWALKTPAADPKAADAKGPAPKAEPKFVKLLPKEGKQFVMLQVKPRDPKTAPTALEGTFLAVSSPKVKLPPGSLVQVSGWAHLPVPLKGSADGALLYDSAGGEPLAVRLTEPTKTWTQFTLYRRVPASGEITVTLALTGVGVVFFDDVRIEPRLESGGETVLRAPTGGVPETR